MRCAKCNSENPATNRFCGQCGASLLSAPAPTADQSWSSELRPVGPVSSAFCEEMARQDEQLQDFRRQSSAPATKVATPDPDPSPVPVEPPADGNFFSATQPDSITSERITGPSFLGLSDDESSGSVDYLYEDEPGHSRFRYVLVLFIAAAFIGFIAYEWHQNWNWTTTIIGRYKAIRAESQAPPQPQIATPPSTTAAGQQPDPMSSPTTTPTSVGSTPSVASKIAPQPLLPPYAVTPDIARNLQPLPPATPQRKPDTPQHREHAAAKKPAPTVSDDARLLSQADAYLYGRGVPRNCQQALTFLRAAANQGSSAARNKLGGLYATGNCVRLDRAEAYNWFTLARDAGSTTVWNQHNREMLWSKMSPSEKARVLEPPR